jgi:hypothetical protein
MRQNENPTGQAVVASGTKLFTNTKLNNNWFSRTREKRKINNNNLVRVTFPAN